MIHKPGTRWHLSISPTLGLARSSNAAAQLLIDSLATPHARLVLRTQPGYKEFPLRGQSEREALRSYPTGQARCKEKGCPYISCRSSGLGYVDVTFAEDRSRLRTGHAPQLLAACRNLAITLIHRSGFSHIAASRRPFSYHTRAAFDLLLSKASPSNNSLALGDGIQSGIG